MGRWVIALTEGVIEAGSLVDLLIEEVDHRLAIVAGSLRGFGIGTSSWVC